MKNFAKMVLKNMVISAGVSIGTFGGLIIVGQAISEFEKFKRKREVKKAMETEDEA